MRLPCPRPVLEAELPHSILLSPLSLGALGALAKSLVTSWSVVGLVVTGLAGREDMGMVRVCGCGPPTPELQSPWRSSCWTDPHNSHFTEKEIADRAWEWLPQDHKISRWQGCICTNSKVPEQWTL